MQTQQTDGAATPVAAFSRPRADGREQHVRQRCCQALPHRHDFTMGAGASVSEDDVKNSPEALAALARVDALEKQVADLAAVKTGNVASAGAGAAGGKRVVNLIHFNDVYNLRPLKPKEPVGGCTRFATVMKREKARMKETPGGEAITVFSGDLFGPSLISAITKGKHMIEVLNMLGTDYGCFGVSLWW